MKTTKCVQRRTIGLRYRRAGWAVLATILISGTVRAAGLTNQDTLVHAPPSTGSAATYDYNLFGPAAANFPGTGGAYTDPVFGSIVRRLTNSYGKTSAALSDIYAHHWANANGTLAFTVNGTIVEVATGKVVHTGQPQGTYSFENFWDALDPDKYYYYSGSSLMRRNLTAQTDTVIGSFPATLESNGGSLNIQSADGRYFTVRYSGTNKIWDSQTNTIYSGAVAPKDTSSWVSITPDAKYIVNASSNGQYSYPIDHTAHSIGAETMFWSQCGDHGDLVSASNGKDYMVTFDCFNAPVGAYRVDVTLPQTSGNWSQQLSQNQMLVPLHPSLAGHFSAVSRGQYADWVFMSVESIQDPFNGGVSGWVAYEQEIIAMNVVTLEVKRLAQHRSRNISGTTVGYYAMPRVSSSWDGSVVLWSSNYNVQTPQYYADLYAIQFPFGATVPPPPIPQNPHFN